MSHPDTPDDPAVPVTLSPPRLPKAVYRRKRLYRQIKRAFDAEAALWVQGPAGAGKTTLVASFLEADERTGLWYLMDAADAEPSAFFRHLRTMLAAVAAAALPVFDPRLTQDPARFAREFFRAYFDRLPAGTTVVLDDYHEVQSEGTLDAILAAAFDELPADRHLVVISRSAVPKQLARARAQGRLECIDGTALRVDDEEALRIAQRRIPRELRAAVPVQDLNHRAQGWVAGLVLMLQQVLSGGLAAGATNGPTPDTIDEYFAGELFGPGAGEEMEVLVVLSFLPRFTRGMAEEMSGDPQVPRLVEDLYRRNFFLSRHQAESGGTSYRLHPLFRDFLAREAARRMAPRVRLEMQLRAAGILAKEGQLDEAVMLYQSAQAWPQAEALLLARAPVLYRDGEFLTMQRWLGGLPDDRIRNNAWLSLWRGAAASVAVPTAGREDLKHAYSLFRSADDLSGALLAWCALVEGYVFEWGELRPLDDWIAAFDDLESAFVQASEPIAQRATFAMFGAVSYRQPFGPRAERWARAAEDVFMQAGDPTIRAFMASQLAMFYAFTRGDLGRAAVFVNEIRVQAQRSPANPMADIVFLVHYAVINLWNTGDVAASLDAVRQGIETANASGVHLMDILLYAVGAWSSITGGQFDLAERYTEGLGGAFNHEALANRCIFHDTCAILNLHRGNVDLARAQSDMSLELARRGGMPFAEAACLLTVSRVRSMAGQWQEAEAYRERAREMADSMGNRFILNHLYWFEAADRLCRDGAAPALEPLRRALGAGRAGNFFANLWLERGTFARLCELALSHDLESDYVRRLIGCLGLAAPDPDCDPDDWPFRLRVEVLGGLQVGLWTDGAYESLALPARSGQLLEALVWLGGQSVSQEQLADLLWPDADGDAARRSFDTTLHRLRRTLGDERLLRLERGRLSLAPGLTWSDVGALERTNTALRRAVQADADEAVVEASQNRLIERAAGVPPSGADHVAFEPNRAALRRELGRTLDRAGAYWQERDAWQKAIAALEARLRLDPVAEAPYLQLMRIHAARGLPAEALAVYRRCRETVRSVLGIAPGPEVEALRQRLSPSQSEA